MSTISSTITTGITLGTSGNYTSPLTITSTGAVETTGGTAVYGPNTQAWTVANYGTIHATNGVGIYLDLGGSVSNNAGLIEAYFGVRVLNAAGTVVNSGTITGRIEGAYAGNAATGIDLFDGGSISNNAGVIEGDAGILIDKAAGAVTNSATILGTGGVGVALATGGSLGNTATAALIEGYTGVLIENAPGTVANLGTIIGTGGIHPNLDRGVYLGVGGSVANNAGLIDGYIAVYITGSAGTVSNAGTILGNVLGVDLAAGGTVNNTGTIAGSGAGGDAVDFGAAGVVTNAAGALISSTASGVRFIGTAGSVDNAGTIVTSAPITGAGIELSAGGQITNETGGLIEAVKGAISIDGSALAGTTTTAGAIVTNDGSIIGKIGIGIGRLDAANNTIDNFGTITGTLGTAIVLGKVGNDRVVIEAGSTLQGVISNFHPGDTFDLPSLTFSNAGTATLGASNVLQVVQNSSTVSIALDPTQSFAGDTFQMSADAGTGTLVTEVCFCRGARIQTNRGEVPVEDLSIGDRVKTLSGTFKSIVWIGFGRDLITSRNSLARPVIVRAGALAAGVPRRDLHLTHGHSLYLDGVLIPVEHLVNHRSIRWDDEARVVEYYHIELEDHDVLLAEGAPAESYYDANNRALFQSTREGSSAGDGKPPCAPVLSSGEVVERVWARLFARAGGVIESDTTDDPDLHLVVDGVPLDPAPAAGGVYTFALAAPPAGAVHLRSRSGVPSLVALNGHDHRRLGVAICQIILHGTGVMTAVDCDALLFRAGGCYAAEGGYCWTDGELALPADLFVHLQGAFTLIVHTRKQAMRYPLSAAAQAA